MRQSNRKTPVVSAVIASVCIVVYLAALVSAVVRIYISVEDRRNIALREFSDVADLAASAGVLGFMNEPFVDTINDALASSGTLEALIISGPDGEYAFERVRDSAINWVNNSPRFKNRIDFLRQPLYLPLRIQGLRNVNIQAVAGAFDYGVLTGILKETLLLVLGGLVLAFFTLLLESLLLKSPVPQDLFSSENVKPPKEEPRPTVIRNAAAGSGDDDDDDDDEEDEDDDAIADYPAPSFAGSGTGTTEESRPVPKGLYSPNSNIGWEEYTGDRLESELHRCASFEQDLTLIIMELKEPAPAFGFFKQFAEDAVHYFTQRDLIFEKGERGITVIYPNIDVETAFTKSEEFHNRILTKHSSSFKSKTDICIGLSSRSGRLIDAERLIFEAGEALERALSDPVSHIVAFKSDPEKYRAFISKHS